ncbi:MAG: hypothetical protein AABW59_05000 [archaeon]
MKRPLMRGPPQRKMLFGRNDMGRNGLINQIIKHRIEVGLKTAAEKAEKSDQSWWYKRLVSKPSNAPQKGQIMPQNAKGRR